MWILLLILTALGPSSSSPSVALGPASPHGSTTDSMSRTVDGNPLESPRIVTHSDISYCNLVACTCAPVLNFTLGAFKLSDPQHTHDARHFCFFIPGFNFLTQMPPAFLDATLQDIGHFMLKISLDNYETHFLDRCGKSMRPVFCSVTQHDTTEEFVRKMIYAYVCYMQCRVGNLNLETLAEKQSHADRLHLMSEFINNLRPSQRKISAIDMWNALKKYNPSAAEYTDSFMEEERRTVQRWYRMSREPIEEWVIRPQIRNNQPDPNQHLVGAIVSLGNSQPENGVSTQGPRLQRRHTI